ncbi:MAG: energy transducer TonB [Acidobacteria bacterium]|nr:energy transducer TonB [Acidobacteriota bacterium]
MQAPQALFTPNPPYPVLAKQAKLQGDVNLDAVIDPSGNVVEVRLVSGHPILVGPAMEAVRTWRYRPTILNDEPVSVQLIVVVHFRLDAPPPPR